jgi:hypothetical protein
MLKLQILELGGVKTNMTEEKLHSLDDVLREMGGFGEKWVQFHATYLSPEIKREKNRTNSKLSGEKKSTFFPTFEMHM